MHNKIYPCLWFNNQAKEAAAFYCTVFNNAHITHENPFVSIFEASGQRFMCMNGCADIKINSSISFFVVYENKEELTLAWLKLVEGGSVLMPLDKYDWSQRYGWVQDRFGVSWQLSCGKFEEVGQVFTPTFMFTGEQKGNAEKAIEYYTSIFPNSSLVGILRYGPNDNDEQGNIKHAQFTLHNQVFMAMDSGITNSFGFNEAVSLVVECKDQTEIDQYWNQLSKGGSEGRCGWLKDQFGVSWQIVPEVLGKLMSDPERMPRVSQAFMKMKKFDIETLENA
jgi:predicted 3-demethylubiquinone-9 3-methyltransferase (glyoxalase superfamily)